MKILHLCLANFYIDNFSYQENILPKFHKSMGLEVEIIASLVSFDENGESCLLNNNGTYFNEYEIPVTRLQYKKSKLSKRFRVYEGTYAAISKANPDVIFIHGCQFIDIVSVKKYVEYNPDVKVYVDNHADFSNSAKNFLSLNFLHKLVWRKCAHLIEPHTTKFYGVLPARVDFLKNIYNLPENKLELLVMGADDEKVVEARDINSISNIRKKHNIDPTDFLVMTGGKIDSAKWQTLLLIRAIKEIKRENLKLIVFGSVTNELKEDLLKLIDDNKIHYIGWIDAEDSYKYFASADLVVFPGRHSVFWEQVVGLGIPMLVKHWKGTSHVDVGGNVDFLYEDSQEEIKDKIENLVFNPNKLNGMKKIAEEKGIIHFSYNDIAKRSIEL